MKKVTKAPGLEYVYNGDDLYCTILRSSYESSALSFFTPDDFSQQLGYLPHPKGGIIKPHIHKESKREVFYTHEVLFVKKGAVKVNLYDQQKAYIGSETIGAGDFILLCGGGHGFEILEDTVMIEIKQGPYMGLEDKERFTGIEK